MLGHLSGAVRSLRQAPWLAALVLPAAALVAAAIPARGAARVDPVVALRST